MGKTQLAVLCNDLHLSHNPPVSRVATREQWYEIMADHLAQLRALVNKESIVICAGDIFDKWNSPPELITFAMKHLPENLWAIPGQHDLPNHALDQQHRSAYGCLVEAGVIRELTPGAPHHLNGLQIFPFPWGHPVKPPHTNAPDHYRLAVAHHYIWAGKSTSYPGAPASCKVKGFTDKLKGYDIAHFGDNHKHFQATVSGCTVWNGGGFMVRKRDEKRAGMVPQVAALYRDHGKKQTSCKLRPHVLRDSGAWLAVDPLDKTTNSQLDMAEFIQSMGDLGEAGIDFKQALRRHVNDNPPGPRAQRMILEALDGSA